MASIAPLDPSEPGFGGQGGATTRALSSRSDLSVARGRQPAGGGPRPGAGADDGPEVRPTRGRGRVPGLRTSTARDGRVGGRVGTGGRAAADAVGRRAVPGGGRAVGGRGRRDDDDL